MSAHSLMVLSISASSRRWVGAREMLTMDYPEGRSFKTIRTAIRSDNTGLCEIKRGPMLGENTVEIMQKVGYGEDEINALIAKGTVSQHA